MTETQEVNVGGVGQKNSVEIFLGALERASRSAKVYAYDSGKNLLENIYENVSHTLERAFTEEEEIEVHIKPTQMIFQRKVVYENKDKRKSLSFALYENGIRALILRKGFTKEEVIQFISVLATDFSKPEYLDEDLYCLFIENQFEHLDVVGSDVLADLQKDNPELKNELKEFRECFQQRRKPVRVSTPRRLRQDDLRTVENFRLNPSQLNKSDQEVSDILKSVNVGVSGQDKERESLERLALMAFHFLLNEKSLEQVQAGRELVAQTAVMMLQAGFIDLYRSVVKKVLQLHQDRTESRGELQKVLDAIFDVQHFETYEQVLQEKDAQRSVIELLLAGPPSNVRLMIRLLPVANWTIKIFGAFVLKNAGEYSGWIYEQAAAQPDLECWERLVNILGQKPNKEFGPFMAAILDSAGESVKIKILRQCALIATKETLRVFESYLESKEEKERCLAYELLPLSKDKKALLMLKDRIDASKFQSFSNEEKQKAYEGMINLGGEASYIWFENLWLQQEKGLFKSKAVNERRTDLASAAFRTFPKFLEKITDKTPLDQLPKEVQVIIEKAMKRSYGG